LVQTKKKGIGWRAGRKGGQSTHRWCEKGISTVAPKCWIEARVQMVERVTGERLGKEGGESNSERPRPKCCLDFRKACQGEHPEEKNSPHQKKSAQLVTRVQVGHGGTVLTKVWGKGCLEKNPEKREVGGQNWLYNTYQS